MPDGLYETDRDGLERPPGTVACLVQTRSAVLNVLVFVGGGIAVSGWSLGRRDLNPPPAWAYLLTPQGAMGGLLGLIGLSYLVLRVGSGRGFLRDPATRSRRFLLGRVAVAVVGALAIPLGFVVGWTTGDPRLEALAPYWIAALGLGFLALPRGAELDDFAEPIPPPPRPADPS